MDAEISPEEQARINKRNIFIANISDLEGWELEFFDNEIDDLLANIQKKKLRFYYENGTCRKYNDLESALIDYKPGQILISFTDLQKYGIFDKLSELRDMFLNYRYNCCGGHNGKIDFIPYQIIVASEKQKLVFVCTDPSKSESITNCVNKCLNSQVVIAYEQNRLEITVTDQVARDYSHATDLFRKLTIHVDKVDRELSECIRIATKRTQRGDVADIDYITVNRSMLTPRMSTDEMGKLFANVHTVNIINGNINGGQVVLNANPQEEKNAAVIRWIIVNPPENKEVTTIYYRRYIAANPNGVNDKLFGPIVHKQGYTTMKGTNNRYWIKV